jgi:hypothetical protein
VRCFRRHACSSVISISWRCGRLRRRLWCTLCLIAVSHLRWLVRFCPGTRFLRVDIRLAYRRQPGTRRHSHVSFEKLSGSCQHTQTKYGCTMHLGTRMHLGPSMPCTHTATKQQRIRDVPESRILQNIPVRIDVPSHYQHLSALQDRSARFCVWSAPSRPSPHAHHLLPQHGRRGDAAQVRSMTSALESTATTRRTRRPTRRRPSYHAP